MEGWGSLDHSWRGSQDKGPVHCLPRPSVGCGISTMPICVHTHDTKDATFAQSLAAVHLRTCTRPKGLPVTHTTVRACVHPALPASLHPPLSGQGKGTPGGSPACCRPVTRLLSRAQRVSPCRPWPPAHPSGHVHQWPQTLNNSATHVFQGEEGPGILAPHPWAPRAPLPQCCSPYGTGHPAPGPGPPQQPGCPSRHCQANWPPAPRGTVCRG